MSTSAAVSSIASQASNFARVSAPAIGSTYNDWLNFLYTTNKTFQVKMGLKNISELHSALGSPLSEFETIHVAGTNGKGSVCWKTASALEAAGCRTGLFMSPHISSYRERMRVNGELISESDVERLLPLINDAAVANNIPASFFEYTTMLGLLYFAEKNANVVVLETGLGGRLDSTNMYVFIIYFLPTFFFRSKFHT